MQKYIYNNNSKPTNSNNLLLDIPNANSSDKSNYNMTVCYSYKLFLINQFAMSESPSQVT